MYLAEAGDLFSRSPSLSRSPCPTERGEAFLQEPGAVAAKFGIVLTELLQTGWLTCWVWSN